MKKELMKKLKMPGKAMDPMLETGDEASELDMPSEEAEPGAGEETPAEENAELAAMEDDVLVQEMEKRGYRVEKMEEEQAEGEEPMAGPDSGSMPY